MAKQSEPDKAIADLSQYITMAPSDPDGYTARGNAYLDKHDYAMALADYDRALAISPTDALALTNRANAVSKQNAAKSPTAPVSTTTPASVDCSQAETHWKSVEEIKTLAAYQDHLTRFPNCNFAALAGARIAQLSANDSDKSVKTSTESQSTPEK